MDLRSPLGRVISKRQKDATQGDLSGWALPHPGASPYDRAMAGRRSKLTPEEKAANVAAGLTPTGRVPQPRDSGTDDPPRFDVDHMPKPQRTRFTPKRKNNFLRVIRETGEVALAAADTGIAIRTAEEHRRNDPVFRDAWDEAKRQHAAIYANEMRRRGVEGWDEPVFGSQGKDTGIGIVGWVRKYSDRLLIEQARKHDPGYTPKQKVESTVTVEGQGLSLDQLSPESRADLRRILERELADDGEPEVS